MTTTEDITSTTVTLSNGESLSTNNPYLEVDAKHADRVLVWLDDGTTGNKPAQYDMEHHVRKYENVDDWMFDHGVTSETARSWSVPASGPRWRVDVTNTSGAQATYRIVVEAIVEE